MMTATLSTARLHWQLGNWEKLADMQVPPPQRGSVSRDHAELLLYKMQGLFVSGRRDEGRELAGALQEARVSRHALGAALVSGTQSNIARAHLANGKHNRAKASIAAAIAQNPELGEAELVEKLRFENEQRHAAMHQPAASARVPYIDVIGPQGSGKTSLIQALCARDGFAEIEKIRIAGLETTQAAREVFDFLFEYPDFAAILSPSMTDMHDADALRQFLTSTILRYRHAAPRPGTALLFDEGFVCRALSFAYAPELDEALLRRYFRTIPLPTYLIALQLPIDKCIERIEQRPKGYSKRMASLPLSARRMVLERMIRITDIAVEAMVELGVPVIECDARDPMEAIVSATIEAILSQPMRER